nr:MAG TPA: hypothetical protein [Crassvirales sp.]
MFPCYLFFINTFINFYNKVTPVMFFYNLPIWVLYIF